MTEQEKDHLFALRGKILDEINRQRRNGEPGKMSDGDIEVTLWLDADGEVTWRFCLYCYLLGPHRRYEWRGKNLNEVLSRAEEDVDRWIKEVIEWND